MGTFSSGNRNASPNSPRPENKNRRWITSGGLPNPTIRLRLARPSSSSAPPAHQSQQPAAKQNHGARFRSCCGRHTTAYIIKRHRVRCNSDPVTNRRSARNVASAPQVNHVTIAEREHQTVNIEKAAMQRIIGGGRRRTAGPQEVVISQKAVALRVQTSSNRKS